MGYLIIKSKYGHCSNQQLSHNFSDFSGYRLFLGTLIFQSSLTVYPDLPASLAKHGLHYLQNSRMHLPHNKLHGCGLFNSLHKLSSADFFQN